MCWLWKKNKSLCLEERLRRCSGKGFVVTCLLLVHEDV